MANPPPLVLDVRPLLTQNKAPLPAILAAAARLAPGQALRLIAPFEPVPLYDLLKAKGLTHEAREEEPGVWVVLFTPPSEPADA